MENLEYIRSALPVEDQWLQLAEECTELSHAAQKMARVIAGRNPTPVTPVVAYEKVHEELSDVFNALEVLELNDPKPLARIMGARMERWVERLKAKEAQHGS